MKEFSGDAFLFGDFADALNIRADGSYGTPFGGADLTSASPTNLGVGGVFTVECFDMLGRRRWVDTLKNGVTNGALDDVLNTYLRNGTVKTNWYIMLVDNSAFSAFSASDTMASHSGWAEFTGYSNTTRLAWSAAASSGQSVTNTSTVDFSVNATGNVKGLALASDSTKSGTTGTLFSTAAFTSGVQAVASGDTLKVTYTVSATAT